MPLSVKYKPADEDDENAPAGLMWSVVTLSPSISNALAPVIGSMGSIFLGMPLRNVGRLT